MLCIDIPKSDQHAVRSKSYLMMSSQHGAGLEPAEPVKKRRRRTKPKESIYIKPDPTPYTPAIRPLKAARPTRQASQAVPLGEEDGAESSCMAIERAEVNDERYRVRALKAWETKRRKQQERFEALESTTWNGESTPPHPGREREGEMYLVFPSRQSKWGADVYRTIDGWR